ncbi:FMN-dependent NADH-azoreductase [Rahnella sikkimica]|uniref:FMN dependent NADH:quinone oxidoreductase n=1 Tax=Rahnella sikkimica TaxID=1805933 RepID=A0A2L1UPR6_9GAMM|nr:NAD(P)H-dependent oxidoreductase [Rahnella sikkimica]AVF34924.1 NAD(P)H dehydrogenase [Rahnella sikkimica]
MKILHVDASSKFHQWSNSRALGRYFFEQLEQQGTDIEIDYLDVTQEVQPHISAEFVQATYTPEDQRTDRMREVLADSDALCKRVMEADALVCAMPMYNWTIPSTFKTFIDNIVRTNITYDLHADGTTRGNLGDKKVLFITTRGADLGEGSPYAAMDSMTPVLRNAFLFMGVENPWFVDAQPLQFSDEAAREAGLAKARSELDAVSCEWAESVAVTAS